jgi:predicted Zn-dependent peptidase
MTPRIDRLDNGLTVVSLAMPGLETASVGLCIDAGSRSEPAPLNGIAHMLEHMVFKGTQGRSARAIAEEIENVGGHLNAFTTRDHTMFYARVLGDDVALGVDLVTDMITAPLFDPADLAKEKDVILQELGQALDTPDDLVFDHLQDAAYPDQPLGRSILGTQESIDRAACEDIRAWQGAHYTGASMVLTAAGKVDHEALLAFARDRLSSLPSGHTPAPQPATYAGGERRDARPLEQVHVALAVPAAPYRDPDHYPQMLFSAALGGGMSSRLFQSVREEEGLVYSIHSSVTPYADSGLFSLYLGTGEETAAKALRLSLEQWRRCIDDLDEAELNRARAQAKAGLFMALESCSSLSEAMARQLLIFDRVIPPAEIVEQINACTVEKVRAAGERLLGGALSLAVVGPDAGVPSLDQCRSWLG